MIKSAKFTSCLFFVFQIKMPWCWRRTPHGPWSQSACRKGLLTHLPGFLMGKLSSTKRPAVIQELQQNVEDVRMRLFHLFLQDFANWPLPLVSVPPMCLIKEYQGVWPPSNSLKEIHPTLKKIRKIYLNI